MFSFRFIQLYVQKAESGEFFVSATENRADNDEMNRSAKLSVWHISRGLRDFRAATVPLKPAANEGGMDGKHQSI